MEVIQNVKFLIMSSMQTGKIDVTTENIFPIIKKFLYSEHEIFLRELISNAIDATQKLKTLASHGDFKGELGDLKINVYLDKKKKNAYRKRSRNRYDRGRNREVY